MKFYLFYSSLDTQKTLEKGDKKLKIEFHATQRE